MTLICGTCTTKCITRRGEEGVRAAHRLDKSRGLPSLPPCCPDKKHGLHSSNSISHCPTFGTATCYCSHLLLAANNPWCIYFPPSKCGNFVVTASQSFSTVPVPLSDAAAASQTTRPEAFGQGMSCLQSVEETLRWRSTLSNMSDQGRC